MDDLKACPQCMMAIHERANICPYCGTKQMPSDFFGKLDFITTNIFKILLWLTLLAIIISITYCTATSNDVQRFKGKFYITEHEERYKYVAVNAAVDDIDIKREYVEPLLKAALYDLKIKYPGYDRFVIWLVPDQRMSWGIAAGRLEVNGDSIEIRNGRPPETAYSDPKWIKLGLRKLNKDELDLAIAIEMLAWDYVSAGIRNTTPLVAKDLEITYEEASSLRNALSWGYRPFSW